MKKVIVKEARKKKNKRMRGSDTEKTIKKSTALRHEDLQ